MKSEFNYELKPGVKVRFIQNRQFKSVQMMVSFIHELENERELASRTLLAGVLESSSAAYPNQHAITLKLAELYGATFGANTEVEGNLSLLNFVYSFVAPEYLAAGQPLLDESVDFLNQIIFHPRMENGIFQPEIFERQRTNLKKYIQGIVDNKQSEALVNVQRLYFDNPIQQNTPYGTEDDYQGLTNQQIVTTYEQMIQQDQVQITVMGDLDYDSLKRVLSRLEFQESIRNRLHEICYSQAVKDQVEVQTKVEPVQQSKLDLVYHLPIDAHQNKMFYAAVVMNALLGGSPQSLLFQNVREKASMAYYAESSYSALRSMVLIQTGIQATNHDSVLALIKQQIATLQQGDFSVERLSKIKVELINERQRMQDSPVSGLEQVVLSELLDCPLDYETQRNGIQAVTKEDVVAAAARLKFQTEFFLKGEMGNGND